MTLPSSSAGPRVSGSAMGVTFTGDHLPGLAPWPGVDERRRCTVTACTSDVLRERWSAASAPRTVLQRSWPDGTPYLTVEQDDAVGFRVWGEGFGEHLLSPTGTEALCDVPEGDGWAGGRLIASQLVPIASTLHGLESLHAAGVLLGDRLVALTAASGTGKTSTTLELLLSGGTLVADDTLAVETRDGSVIAHHGTNVLNVPHDVFQRFSPADRARLGTALGESYKVHVEAALHRAPVRLAALIHLDRPREATRPEIVPDEHSAQRILGSAYIPWTVSPERQLRLLEVAQAIGTGVPCARVVVGPGEAPAAVAERIRAWVAGA